QRAIVGLEGEAGAVAGIILRRGKACRVPVAQENYTAIDGITHREGEGIESGRASGRESVQIDIDGAVFTGADTAIARERRITDGADTHGRRGIVAVQRSIVGLEGEAGAVAEVVLPGGEACGVAVAQENHTAIDGITHRKGEGI